MWRKTLIGCVMLLTASSLAYVYCSQELNAATSTYQAGGNVTGRINLAPNNLTGENIGIKKGDKFYVGAKNPKNGKDLGFIAIIYNENYTDYITPVRTTPVVYGNSLSGWFTMSTDSIAETKPANGPSDFNKTCMTGTWRYVNYNNSNIAPKINQLTNAFLATRYGSMLMPRDLENLRLMWNNPTAITAGVDMVLDTYEMNNSFFNLDTNYISLGQSSGYDTSYSGNIPVKDYAFSSDYWTNMNYYNSGSAYSWEYRTGATGLIGVVNNSYNVVKSVRPSGFLDLDDVVFGVSKGSGYGIAEVDEFELSPGYSSLWESTKNIPHLKLRLKNSSMTADLHDIKDADGKTITKIIKDKTVMLDATANSGSDTDNNPYTLSVIIFDEKGDFKYYKPLESAKGSGLYEFDTSGIEVGKYKIAVVNESYNESNSDPTDSSLISDIKDLEIVAPHKLAYTKTPQSGATIGDYEFSKNVNVGQAVGKITVNPQGVMPLTYTIEANGDNTYQNFEIDGLNSSGASSSTSLNVKIKSGAPDLVNGGLKAGNYKFCITAVDANGDPVDTSGNPTEKVCTSFTVEKTNPTIAFNDPAQTKKSIAAAATAWNETATANPNSGTKITYSVSGGDVSLISINPDTGAITYTGSNAFGKVKIRATVDDDPTTGNDNYNSAFVEKEIVIYREVDGSVTPHANSSDTTIPTFTASDSNIRTGGIIGTIHGTLGTPDTIGGTTTTYHYGLKPGVGNASFFSVDPNTGVIKTTGNLGINSYHITVTVSDNWSTKEIPVTINVGVAAAENLKFYENSTSNTVITSKSVKATDTGVTVYATVKGSTNNNPVTYRIKDGSTNVITVNSSSGAITINGVGTVIIVAEKNGAAGQANASTELTFTVTAGSQNFIYTDNAGNELPKQTDKYKAYEEVYEKDKTFQLYTAGNPVGSSVTYQLKAGSPTDVISVDSDGLVHILNASLNTQMGKVIVEATSHDPTGNYADKTIELPINIKKAEQTISFADVTYATNGKGKVTPVINEQDLSSNAGGVTVNDTDYYITVDTSVNTSTAWTNDGIEIEYDYDGEEGIDIPLHVEKQGNRNYNKAEADGILHIMGPDENMLAVSSPGKIIYGDHFTIKSTQFDADSTNVQYTFEIDDTTYVSNPTVNGNIAEFDALKYSGKTNITIKVTRTADGETPLSKNINVQVLPKPIEIKIDDKEKYKGEVNPTLTYQDFRSQLVTWNGVQDVIQENDIKLSTTAKTNSNAGDYPIKGDSNTLNKTYPNYSFKFKEGTLTIKEDNIEDDWYHLEINDGNNTAYEGKWTNQDVNIISDHAEYINLSLDQSTWKPNQVTVSKEGETNQSFWMKKDSGAITKEKQELIKIDKTPPKVKGIKAKDTNNILQDIINKLSGGIFFKPGTAFEITTSDAKDDLKVSGTKEISYKVYKLDTMARAGEELIKEGKLTVTKEKASITISETTAKYKVCVIPTDNAGNTNTESCHEVELKKIDVDVDGNGKPDFNDPDRDGCPDLNIKWKDPNDEGKWIVINGDRDGDGIPDLYIDSDGDGKPDLNIDTDKDGKPDLNLVILKKSDWKPTKCVKQDIENGILEEYCTGTSVKAVINIDTDHDGIPNINIDTNGDMKADINIDTDNDSKANVNIAPIHTEWKPNKDYSYGKPAFRYDTAEKYEPLLNIDSDGDGRPDINIDLDGDGVADLNIDTDGDRIPNINIDSDGDGKPDINVDVDDDGKPDENIKEITEWKPNKNVDGDLPYDTMEFNDKEEPSNPDDQNQTGQKDDSVSGNTTDENGYYYPGKNVGGAMTGDETDIILHLGYMGLGIGVIVYLYYRYQKNTFQ